jgi:hypothetical protein
MQWQRRILLIASATPQDPNSVLQRRILTGWEKEAADRDVSLVEVYGDRVTGAADTAASLRDRYHLEPGTFQALLIGKDGHVALRSDHPIDATILQGTIDAMPMRRAGER